jgi:hypothetical protein
LFVFFSFFFFGRFWGCANVIGPANEVVARDIRSSNLAQDVLLLEQPFDRASQVVANYYQYVAEVSTAITRPRRRACNSRRWEVAKEARERRESTCADGKWNLWKSDRQSDHTATSKQVMGQGPKIKKSPSNKNKQAP